MKNKYIVYIFFLVSLLFPIPAFCDLIWPALYFEEIGILTWWVIGLGLIIEFPFYFIVTNKNIKKALLATFVCNLISTIAGIIFIPLLGIFWEMLPGYVMDKFFNIGTFNPITYVATIILAVVASTFFEVLFLKEIFKIYWHKKTNIIISIANLLSTSLAIIPVINKYRNVFIFNK